MLRIIALALIAGSLVAPPLRPSPVSPHLFPGLEAGEPPVHDPPEPQVDVIHYRFSLSLTDDSNRVQGHAWITVRLLEAGIREFGLDLVGRNPGGRFGMNVEGVWRDGVPVAHRQAEDRLTISLSGQAALEEVQTFEVAYGGIPADGLIVGENLHGDRTFFGDNWPTRARFWLPTVDDPSDKATVEWMVQAPEHYEVVANGRLVEKTELEGGRELTRWESEVPIPTKVMVIGVADFVVDTVAIVDGIPVEAWVYPQDRDAGLFDFALSENALRFLSEYIGPFPYEKLANVQSTTRYGGMENASNIFYAERAIRGDRRNESLIVHETAHQWFGDSVTELEWPDVWLSEGFATYMTHLYEERTYGREALVEGMQRDRRTVIQFHALRPDLPLIPVQLTDPEEMLNPNAYQKGSWVLHMLRREMGDEEFREGIREFYRRYRDGNARTADLQMVMEEVGGKPLDWFFAQWARGSGYPVLETEWAYDPGTGRLTVTVRQVQTRDRPFRFPLDLAVEFGAGPPTALGTVAIEEAEQSFTFQVEREPDTVFLDPDTWLLFEEAVSSPI